MMHRVHLCLAAILSCGTARAADKPQFGPPPAWVRATEIPLANAPAGEAPTQVLLNDQQVRFSQGVQELYSELAVRVQTARGLEKLGTVTLPWNPETSTLTVNRLRILRGTRVIDVMGNGQAFVVLRRENNLQGAVLDGVLTAAMQPPGLVVGDVLDVASTVRGSDPAMQGQNEVSLGFWPVQPTAHLRLRAQWSPEMKMHWQAVEGLSGITQGMSGTEAELKLAMDDVVPQAAPSGAPTRFLQPRRLQISSFESWAQIAAQFAPLYRKASVIPPQSALQDEVARIRSASADPVARAEAALALVQEQVRYVFLAANDGGLLPADADTTWVRRFGDCKGKTVLLLGLLDALGVDATPVLVSARNGDGLDHHLPMVGAFDHVLIRSVINGRTYWLDGTRAGDRHIGGLAVPAFYWGLPLLPRNAVLVAIRPVALAEPAGDNEIHIDARGGFAAPAPVQATITLRGDGGMAVQRALADQPDAQRDQSLRAIFLHQFDSVKINSVKSQYDAALGAEILSMDGSLQIILRGGRYELEAMRVSYAPKFDRAAGPQADAPYRVPFPMYERRRETILLPASSTGVALDGEQIDRTVAGVHFSRTAHIRNGSFEGEVSWRGIQPEFPASEAPAAQAALSEISHSAIFLRPLQYYAAPKQDPTMAVLGQPSTGAERFLAHGNMMMDRGEFAQAVADFDKALFFSPGNAMALADRGMAEVWQDNLASAREDLDDALAADPRNAVAYRARGFMAQKQTRYADAVAAFTAALNYAPANAFALSHRAGSYDAMGDSAHALADSEALTRQRPNMTGFYEFRARIYWRNGQADLAAREAAAVQAANPTSARAFRIAGVIYSLLGRDDDAEAAYEKSLLLDPAEDTYLARAQTRRLTDHVGRNGDIEAALRANPKSARALGLRADMQQEAGQYAAAVATLTAALDIKPDSAVLLAQRGADEALLRQDSAAAKDLAEARAKARDANDHNGICWREAIAGIMLDAALGDCDAALAVLPQFPSFLDSRGMVLLRLGRLDESIATYSAALRGRPDEAMSLYGRGIGENRKGEAKAAAADMARATLVDRDVAGRFASYGVR